MHSSFTSTRSFFAAQTGRLDQRHFMMTLVAALVLHLVALGAYSLRSKVDMIEVPVRALNIKLGDGDAASAEQVEAAQPDAPNVRDVEAVIARMVRADEVKVQSKPTPKPAPTAKAEPGELVVPSRIPKQFVRTPGNKTEGTALGNSTAKSAELVARYEQVISLWIQKFKQYPEEARAAALQGKTVVRIRIDRRGNIGYYALEYSTDSPILDRAAIHMIRRANPVPAVPNDYPEGDLLEFLIPVNFQLQ